MTRTNDIIRFLIIVFVFSFIIPSNQAWARDYETDRLDNNSETEKDIAFDVINDGDINGDERPDFLLMFDDYPDLYLYLSNDHEEEFTPDPEKADFILVSREELNIIEFGFMDDIDRDGLDDIFILYENEIEGTMLSAEILDRTENMAFDQNPEAYQTKPVIIDVIINPQDIQINPLLKTDFRGVWGPQNSNIVYLAGSVSSTKGVIYKYDGNKLTEITPYPMSPMKAIWGDPTGTHIWFAGSGLHYHGPWAYPDWAPFHGAGGHNDVWGSSENNIFVACNNMWIDNIVRGSSQFYGSSLEYPIDYAAYKTTPELEGIWGTAANDVFIVGGAGDYYFDSSVWDYVNEPPVILHYDGKNWSQMNNDAEYDLNGVWGSSSTNVYAVGDFGTLLHYDGKTWTQIKTGTNAHLMDAWGTSANNIFVVGGKTVYPYKQAPKHVGVILHYDGTQWTKIKIEGFLADVWGRSATDVYAVGFSGLILHYDGKNWSKIQ